MLKEVFKKRLEQKVKSWIFNRSTKFCAQTFYSVNKYTYKIRTRPTNVRCKIFWEWSQPVLSSVVCPVSGVLSSPPSPLSPSFLAAKNILLMSVTIQLKNLLLFAPTTVGLGTAVWLFWWLGHDALIVLQGVAMKIFNEKLLALGPPRYLNYKF